MDISTFPENADIRLNGLDTSSRTPAILTDLDTGDYTVRLRLKDFLPFEKNYAVEDQFVSLIRNIFLLPEAPRNFIVLEKEALGQPFITKNWALFPEKNTARFLIYSKTGNESFLIEAPFSEPVDSIIERGNTHLILVLKNILYDLNTENRQIKRLLPARDFKKVLLSENDPDTIFYLATDRTFFEYNILAGKEEALLYNVASVALARDTFVYCDSILNQSYSVELNVLRTRGSLGVEKNKTNFCPLNDLFEQNGHTVLTAGNDLYIDQILVTRQVTNIVRLESGRGLLYSSGSSFYIYDFPTAQSRLITRFDDPVQSIGAGPDERHFFVLTDTELFFCDMNNDYCQNFLNLNRPGAWLWFDTDHLRLFFMDNSRLFRMDFSFWEKTGWF